MFGNIKYYEIRNAKKDSLQKQPQKKKKMKEERKSVYALFIFLTFAVMNAVSWDLLLYFDLCI